MFERAGFGFALHRFGPRRLSPYDRFDWPRGDLIGGETGNLAAEHCEVLIADNGSTDDSLAIAQSCGARVVHVAQRGYGAALRGGIAASRGRYVLMGDCDGSYDFREAPRFVEQLSRGFALVVGNRFSGTIAPGAMPRHHP